ncbi:MAG TPA: hypothetical protein VKH63_18050, partial [Candidatus Acidoferrum sp.]|nr:hypothetical protein [Candidatus Acidoferrum sp.]
KEPQDERDTDGGIVRTPNGTLDVVARQDPSGKSRIVLLVLKYRVREPLLAILRKPGMAAEMDDD